MSPTVVTPTPTPAPAPTPNPNANPSFIGGAWEGIKGAPKWVYVAIVGGGIAIWYGFTKIKPSKSSNAKEGIPAVDSTTPIGSIAGDNITTPLSDDAQAYWFVQVAPAGWASTLNGIALQFYGTTGRVNEIQKANPDITQKPYEKLATGLKVKVPR